MFRTAARIAAIAALSAAAAAPAAHAAGSTGMSAGKVSTSDLSITAPAPGTSSMQIKLTDILISSISDQGTPMLLPAVQKVREAGAR